eukprot:10048336-Ditylum_brightwellii.AAC.1
MSSSREDTKTAYQPGRTLSAATGKSTGRVYASESDELGRWSIMHLKGMNKRKISVINSYRVYEITVESAGPLTAWMQQWQALREKEVKKLDPRNQFLEDLSDKVVLALNTNEDLGDKQELRELVKSFSLIAAHEQLHQSPSNIQKRHKAA